MDLHRPSVVLFVDDLFFSARLADAVTAEAGIPRLVENLNPFLSAMGSTLPVLALVDLHVNADWAEGVRRCRLTPHTRAIPIYGFGRHTDVDTLKRARSAGADRAWARSRLVEELPRLLATHIHPEVPMPAGSSDPLPARVREGIRLFNDRRYHAQHEAFEDAWNEEPRAVRDMYQGILQVGLAFLQIEARNRSGALKMMGRGLPRLRFLPDVVQGIEVQRLVRESLAVFALLTAEGTPPDWTAMEARFPLIHMA